MKTIQVNLYTATELKAQFPKGFEKAHADFHQLIHSEEWWLNTYDDFSQVAAILGVEFDTKGKNHEPAIYFSGFSSQGDGACFVGAWTHKVDASEKIREYAPLDEELHRIADALQACDNAKAKVTHNCRYYHAYSADIEVWKVDEEELSPHDETVTSALRDFMNWMYHQLEGEAENQTCEESFLDAAEANEWTFEANGEMNNA